MLGFSVPIPDLSILRVAAAVLALYSLLLLPEHLLLRCDPKHLHLAQTPWMVVIDHTNSRKNATGDIPAHILSIRIRYSVFPHARDLCILYCRVLLLCGFALFLH